MLTDPLAVAASSPNPAYSYVRIKSDGYGSEYLDVATKTSMIINHERGKSNDRHYLKLSVPKDAVNPYTSQTQRQILVASLSVTVPSFGFTETEVVNFVKQMLDTLADADFTVTKFVEFQS